jgi:hypothetical protein
MGFSNVELAVLILIEGSIQRKIRAYVRVVLKICMAARGTIGLERRQRGVETAATGSRSPRIHPRQYVCRKIGEV